MIGFNNRKALKNLFKTYSSTRYTFENVIYIFFRNNRLPPPTVFNPFYEIRYAIDIVNRFTAMDEKRLRFFPSAVFE